MSDLLSEMEARRTRVRKSDAPVAPMIAAFSLLVGLPFLAPSLVAPGVAEILGGQASLAASARAIGIIVGLGLAGGAVLWAALWFGLVRKSRPAWALPLLGGLAAAGVIGFGLSGAVFGHTLDREHQERVAATGIRDALDVFLKHSLDKDYKVTPTKARGGVGGVEKGIKTEVAALVMETRRHKEEIETLFIGADDLDTTREGLNATKTRYEKAEKLAIAYRAGAKARMVTIRKALRDDLSPWVKRAYLPGYEEEFGVRQGDLDRALALQEQAFAARKDQVTVLLDSYGAWTRQGRAIIFRDQDAMRKFNATMMEFDSLNWRIRDMDAAERLKAGEFLRRPPVIE